LLQKLWKNVHDVANIPKQMLLVKTTSPSTPILG
jgi:hypothetical protein